MTDRRQAAMEIVRAMLDPETIEHMSAPGKTPGFAAEISELALDNVFGSIWTRPGLGMRERSLVTLGILIALRAENELRFHFPAAIRNGLTKDEIAEVIYHCSSYAGFPAAASARTVAASIFDKD